MLRLHGKWRAYEVVPKGLLPFLVVFTKKKWKLLLELWRIASRDKLQKKKKNLPFYKHWVLDLERRILSQELSDSCILYFNVKFHGKYAEEDISRQLVTYECCDNWNSWSFGDPVLHLPKWIQCDLLKPITLSLSSHTTQSVNNNPWRHRKDPQTSQVIKCPDIFRKFPTGTELCIA